MACGVAGSMLAVLLFKTILKTLTHEKRYNYLDITIFHHEKSPYCSFFHDSDAK